jgi:hypothetical protein
MHCLRLAILSSVSLVAAGCPGDDDDPATPDAAGDDDPADAAPIASTHSGIVSIQDATLVDAPQLGHGLTVTALFTAVGRAADYDGAPGQLAGGCRAWRYDLDAGDPPPAILDEGTLTIAGIQESIPDGCTFAAPAGYRCPIRTATAAGAAVVPMSGPAMYELPAGAFTAADAGRYLELTGATAATNAGRFPIVAVVDATHVVVGNPAATAETGFAASYAVVAGGGPVPNNPRDPIADDDVATLGLDAGGGGHFAFPDAAVAAGNAFTPDTATLALLGDLPVDGAAFTLRCDGAGGDCGTADASLMLLRTTDGDPTGSSPFALPPPRAQQVEILCAFLGGDGSIAVPAAAAALIAEAHAASPITRIRVAYMRDGVTVVENPIPPANTTILAVGHSAIGFTDVAP